MPCQSMTNSICLFHRELYKEIGLLKLKDRREHHKLIQLFKMQNDLTPASLSTLIPNRFQDVHTYNTIWVPYHHQL
jgi:hypothetical protein